MGQAVVNAYLVYKKVCDDEKKKPMTHLDFHVAVATAWCKSPKIVLEHEKPTRAEARAAAEAAEPEQGGVRGERQRANRAAAAAAGPTPPPNRARSKSPASGKASYMTATKLEKAKQSYTTSPELHTVEMPLLTLQEEVSNCQICGTARGMRKPEERYQTMAHLRCKECNINVCGAGCWQLLHGFYDAEKGEVLPCRAEVIQNDEQQEEAADDEAGGADDEAHDEDDDDNDDDE